MRKFLIGLLASLVILSVGLFATFKIVTSGVEFGGNPVVDRAHLFKDLPIFRDGQFQNTIEQRPMDLWVNLKEFFGDQVRVPPSKFPAVRPTYNPEVPPGLRAVWFGHASVLVEIDGRRIFFDPMLSEFAFPIEFVAPQRMNPSPLPLEELPKIDAALISHDHYDHLDMKTVQHLSKQGTKFFVGIGVGAHLARWEIPEDQIIEMKWGDSVNILGLTFNCTEARHYSGRKSMSKDSLWVSWLVQGPEHSVYHSGDSGYSPHFKQIGEQFPDLDLSLIKVGDYGNDPQWQDIHMMPESSVQAHLDLGAKVMLPIHWGVFELSFHPWDEPIERTMTAATAEAINMLTPKLGEQVVIGSDFTGSAWWRAL